MQRGALAPNMIGQRVGWESVSGGYEASALAARRALKSPLGTAASSRRDGYRQGDAGLELCGSPRRGTDPRSKRPFTSTQLACTRRSIRNLGGPVVRRNGRTQGGKHQNPFSYIPAIVTENREPEHYVVARRRVRHAKGPKLIGIKGVTLRQTVAVPDREQSALGPPSSVGAPAPPYNQIRSLPVQL